MKLTLDYTVTELHRRQEIVTLICEKHENDLSPQNLENLANYLLIALDKKEKREKRILTDNRLSTINKRETSMEGLSDKLENGEDGIYPLMHEDKNAILSPKISITEKDLEEIPFLKQIKTSIERLKAIKPRNYIIQQAIINLSQTLYMVKMAYRKPISFNVFPSLTFKNVEWSDWIDFKNTKHVSAIIKNYSKLRDDLDEKVQDDLYWVVKDFERLVDDYLRPALPHYFLILVLKIDGLGNDEINERLLEEFGFNYSNEYLSTLFNKKLPKVISEMAIKEELLWEYTFKKKGTWKKCGRCGQIKLARQEYFSKNTGTPDGFYSICKECRSRKVIANKTLKTLKKGR